MAATISKTQGGPPGDAELTAILGDTKALWDELIGYLETDYSTVTRQWQRSGQSALSHLRLIRKKRTLVYLLPHEGYFLTAFVFGEKATTAIRASDLPPSVITALNEARVYAEGRGIRLETRTRQDVAIMRRLANFKMAKYG